MLHFSSLYIESDSLRKRCVLAGVKPCIISYNTVMDACVRGRGMLRAIGLAKELPRHGLMPDETTFAILLVLMLYITIFSTLTVPQLTTRLSYTPIRKSLHYCVS